MTLREQLGRLREDQPSNEKTLFEAFGVLENPFPAAGQTSSNPHSETDADRQMAERVATFERDNRKSQVVVVEGTQGVGKTNFLNYYQEQFEDFYSADKAFYVIRYYPDPEPTFDAILRKVVLELGSNHLSRVAAAVARASESEGSVLLANLVSHDMASMFRELIAVARQGNQDELNKRAALALDWMLGNRFLKDFREKLGVRFRLDTTEAKTQALRDLVRISDDAGQLKGLFLLLDELEKQDYSLSKTPVLRFLSGIRALIDALPRCLFLMVALTPDARRRYFEMLPAMAGRLQNIIRLQPLRGTAEAQVLARFYTDRARRKALATLASRPAAAHNAWRAGAAELFDNSEVAKVFAELQASASKRGQEGVTQRDLLNKLHLLAEDKFEVALVI